MSGDVPETPPGAASTPARRYPHALRLRPWAWHIVYVLAQILLRIRHRILVRAENVPRDLPVVIAVKHASGFDIPLLTWISKHYLDAKPYFQMGSFVGYRMLGRLVPVMRALGGFPVMRPKEVLRLKRFAGMQKARVQEIMNEVNGIAEATRQEILRTRQVLVFFPEGTRDDQAVNPIRGTHEIASALGAVAEGVPVHAWPVVLSYGPRRFLRRLILVDLMPPFPLGGETTATVISRLEQTLHSTWIPPALVPPTVSAIGRESAGGQTRQSP